VTPNMYFSTMDVTEFDYARKLAPMFKDDGKLQFLESFGESWGLMPTASAVVFIDNHDSQRGEAQLTYKDGSLYQLANIFMLAHPYGYPKVMSSYYFSAHDQGPPKQSVHGGSGSVACGNGQPWVCEHRWTPVANMVAWRRSAGTSGVTSFTKIHPDAVSFCRGTAACVVINRNPSTTWTVTVKMSVPAGKYCDIIQSDDTSSCPTVSVASDGTVNLEVRPMSAVALHVGKLVAQKNASAVIV